MFKTHKRRTVKIGSENWLKRNTKTVLIAFFYQKNKDFLQ